MMKYIFITFAIVAISILKISSANAGGDPVAGEQKAAVCVACHGPTGISPAPTFPNLAGQYADYLEHTLKGYRDGSRENAIMAGFAATLSDEDIEDLSAFYASQEGLSVVKP